VNIKEKSKLLDSIADLVREYWYTTGEKDEVVRQLANKLESMANDIQVKEYEYQVNKEGIKLFTTHWEDMFGELNEGFWERYKKGD
jgi:hypothetical protein